MTTCNGSRPPVLDVNDEIEEVDNQIESFEQSGIKQTICENKVQSQVTKRD